MKKRLGFISLFTLLFIGFILNWGYSYKQGLENAYIPVPDAEPTPIIPSERGVFLRSEMALDYAKMPVDENHQRSMKTYYNNRAFSGAPPSIPHPLLKGERGMGGKACLQCHQNGGFTEQFNAYAPVTPHPEMINCRQCHVAENTNTVFKGTDFVKVITAKVGTNNALLGSPPVIPHQIQMRENCLSCHAGPAAPKEIRVTHPERINCRQCHVPMLENSKLTDLFSRTKNVTNE